MRALRDGFAIQQLPVIRQVFGRARLGLDLHDIDLVGQAQCELQPALGHPTPGARSHDHDRVLPFRHLHRLDGRELLFDDQIMPMYAREEQEQQRHDQHGEPRALAELRDRHHDERQPRRDRTGRIDHHEASTMRIGRAQPMHDHPGLRQCKREECTDREQRDQLVGDAPNATSSAAARIASTMIPVENTRRRPRSANDPGR